MGEKNEKARKLNTFFEHQTLVHIRFELRHEDLSMILFYLIH